MYSAHLDLWPEIGSHFKNFYRELIFDGVRVNVSYVLRASLSRSAF